MVLIHNRIHSLKILNAGHTSSIYKYMNTTLERRITLISGTNTQQDAFLED
jgi:hypothetical protein